MSTVHEAKIIFGYYSDSISEEILDSGGFDVKFEGKEYEFSTNTEGDVFGITIQETEWAEDIDMSKLQFSQEFIDFVKKECETTDEPKLILAWNKY